MKLEIQNQNERKISDKANSSSSYFLKKMPWHRMISREIFSSLTRQFYNN